MEYVNLSPISMKNHPELSEAWLQGVIEADPSVLGLGELDHLDSQRPQPQGGRLDMLLADPDRTTRYEVELQLGPTDPSHIIRTLEYWETERRLYPAYNHVAVIVAEVITDRFHNVIALFSGPIAAIQVTALETEDNKCALVFTKVLDHSVLGDEEDRPAPANRALWVQKSVPKTMALADRILAMVRERYPKAEHNYTKHYIGLRLENGTAAHIIQRPQQKQVNLEFKITEADDVTDRIIEDDLTPSYAKAHGYYKLIIHKEEYLDTHADLITFLINRAATEYQGG
ncbi:hypothetical protein [Candidatus Spongiisocius sp.]|uniref:hypothetical protein n=1 Tax=Candidatus Spongiisocius sp. TaxID=3101273 RepID=UPI003B5C577E